MTAAIASVVFLASGIFLGFFINTLFRDSSWPNHLKWTLAVVATGALFASGVFFYSTTSVRGDAELALCDQAGMTGTEGLTERCVDALECLNDNGVEAVNEQCGTENIIILELLFDSLASE